MIVRARFREPDPVASEPTSADARMLALAYAVEETVEDGRFRSVSKVAMALGLSRSRLSRVIGSRWACVELQERILGKTRRVRR